jgi:superfamily II DNA or RNA helicase
MYEQENFYSRIKKHLERDMNAYQSSTIYTHQFFLESEKFLLVPRFFPLDQYISDIRVDNKQHEGRSISIQHSIQPRGNLQRVAMEYMLKSDRGTLQLAPGVGKTVISIYMIAERKRNTIILVHRNALSDQWKERVLEFTNLNKDDIAQLKSSKFKEDLHKPIVISTVQTFISLLNRSRIEFLTELDKANIGIMIADEVHTTVGAPTFAECSIHVPSKITFGLSATPYRYDGNDDIIRYHLGPVFSDVDMEDTMPANVKVLLLDYEIDTPKKHYYLYWGGEFQRSRYLNQMKKSEPFIRTVKGLIEKLKDREMIVMMERIKLIDEIYNWLDFQSKSRFYRSSTAEKLDSQITFTTPGKCRDGIDAPQKDCMVMTSPISNIEQLAGRITRKKKDKKRPLLIDMVDYGCSNISRTIYKRLDYYENKNWPVEFILIKDGQAKQIDKNAAIALMMKSGG